MLLEESIPAVWASLNSWFTPTFLFVFLNVMIGTIAVASGGFGTNPKQTQDPNNNNQQPHQLVRSPSVLQRIRSINLNRYRSQELTTTPFSSITTTTTTTTHPPPPQTTTEQSFQHVLDDFHEHNAFDNFEDLQTHTHTSAAADADSAISETETPTTFYNVEEDHQVVRTLSDTKPASGNMPVKLSKKMKKSASAKSAFSHFEVQEETANLALRPSTVREGKKKELQSFGDDEEVDAKADDFINKFKQQLKLQRLDSILRYKEMLGRGTHEN